MRFFRLRLPFSLLLTLTAALMVGVSAQLGRSLATTVVAAQLSDSRPDLVAYMLVDVERRITASRAFDLPDGVDARWWDYPPLVLQRHRRFEFADWTLSILDLKDGSLSPLMVLTTLDNARIRVSDILVRQLSDGRLHASVYVPHSGEIWLSASDAPHAFLRATVERNLTYPLFWSPDGTYLAVKAPEAAGLILMDASGSSLTQFEAPPATWTSWSPDSSKILLSPTGVMDYDQPVMVIDVARASAEVLVEARFVTWCGQDIVYIRSQASGGSLVRLDSTSSTHMELLPGLSPDDAELASVYPLRADSCGWLYLDGRFGTPRRLLHTATGALSEMGADVRLISLSADSVTYVALADNDLEIRRLALSPGAVHEVLAVLPRTFADIRWIDGWQRGVFVDYRALTLFDVRALRSTDLTGQVVRAFVLSPSP